MNWWMGKERINYEYNFFWEYVKKFLFILEKDIVLID